MKKEMKAVSHTQSFHHFLHWFALPAAQIFGLAADLAKSARGLVEQPAAAEDLVVLHCCNLSEQTYRVRECVSE